jgi:hypothetical protein
MLGIAVWGGLIAGGYGILHDQVTYTLAPEYFTKLKFDQFAWADFGLPARVFVGEIGFIASWWVGCFSAWVLARVAVPAWPIEVARRRSFAGFGLIFGAVLLAGLVGGILGGLPGAVSQEWTEVCSDLGINDVPAFVRVAYIHTGSYLGGIIGLITALLWLGRLRRKDRFEAATKPAGSG